MAQQDLPTLAVPHNGRGVFEFDQQEVRGARPDLGDEIETGHLSVQPFALGDNAIHRCCGRGCVAKSVLDAFDDGWRKLSTDQLVARRGLFNAALIREVLFRTTHTNDKGEYLIEGFDPQEPADLAFWAPGLAPRVASFARRFSPDACIVMGAGDTICWDGESWSALAPISRLAPDGTVEKVTSW